jgi:hypothetical protein
MTLILHTLEKSVVLIHMIHCRYRLNPNFFTPFVLQVRSPCFVVGKLDQRVVLYRYMELAMQLRQGLKGIECLNYFGHRQ